MSTPSTPERLLFQRLEALLVVAEGPLASERAAQACGVSQEEAEAGLKALEMEYEGITQEGTDRQGSYPGRRRGFELLRTSEGWRLRAKEEHLDILEPVAPPAPKLSRAALETLAIIAYRQPITRSQVAHFRGVSADSVIRSLLGRELICELPALPGTGTAGSESKNTGAEGVEGAVSYVLSARCLERLGVDSVQDLPPLAPLLPEPYETERLDSAMESVDPTA